MVNATVQVMFGKNKLQGTVVAINANGGYVICLPSGKQIVRKNVTVVSLPVIAGKPANPNNQPATVVAPQPVQQQKKACRTQLMGLPYPTNKTIPMPAIAQKQAQAQLPTVLPAMAYTPRKYLLARQQANLRSKPSNGITSIMAKIGAVPLPVVRIPSLRIVGMCFMALLLFVVLCGIAYTATATATATNMPKAKRAVNAMVSPLHNWPINSSPWF